MTSNNTPKKKGLGTFDFFCVGFGAIVGVGWAVSLNKWMASTGGPFLGLGLIDPLTTFSSAAYVLSWGMAAYCLIKLRKSEPNLPRPYKIPGGLPMAYFAAAAMTILLIMLFIPGSPAYIGGLAVKMFIGWSVIGILMYFITAPARNKKSKQERYDAMFASAKNKV